MWLVLDRFDQHSKYLFSDKQPVIVQFCVKYIKSFTETEMS